MGVRLLISMVNLLSLWLNKREQRANFLGGMAMIDKAYRIAEERRSHGLAT